MLPILKTEEPYSLKSLDQNIFSNMRMSSTSKTNKFPCDDLLANFEIEGEWMQVETRKF